MSYVLNLKNDQLYDYKALSDALKEAADMLSDYSSSCKYLHLDTINRLRGIKDDRLYIVDKADIEPVDDFSLKWHIPKKVTYATFDDIGMPVKETDSGLTVMDQYCSSQFSYRIDSSQQEFSNMSPDEVKKEIIETLAGRARTKIAYITYSPDAAYVNEETGEKAIRLEVCDKTIAPEDPLSGKGLRPVFFIIKADNPYDFQLTKADLEMLGNPYEKFGVVALPADFKMKKRNCKIPDNKTFDLIFSQDFKIATCTRTDGKRVYNGDTNSKDYSFAQLAHYVDDARLYQTCLKEFEEAKRVGADPETLNHCREAYAESKQQLWQFDELRGDVKTMIPEYTAVAVDPAFIKQRENKFGLNGQTSMENVYIIPCNTGKYELNIDMDKMNGVWNGRVNLIVENMSEVPQEYHNIHCRDNHLRFTSDYAFDGFTISSVEESMHMFNSIPAETRKELLTTIAMSDYKELGIEQVDEARKSMPDKYRQVQDILDYGNNKERDRMIGL